MNGPTVLARIRSIFRDGSLRMERGLSASRRHFRRNLPAYVVTGLLTVFLVLYFWRSIFITVHAGEAGVLYHRFFGGTVVDQVYGEGIHIIPPWDIMTVYPMRYQNVNHEMEALTRSGLKVHLGISIRYKPERQVLGVLHQRVGPDFLKKIVIPEVEAEIRSIIGVYEADEVYASKKGVIQQVVNESLAKVSQRFVRIDDVLITKVDLPEKITAAIEGKLEQQQLAQAYVYKLKRERSEAERKRIEAAGIKAYNSAVDESLNERLLQWKGVEATLELSKSPNSKVIIVGTGKNGLPVIMDHQTVEQGRKK